MPMPCESNDAIMLMTMLHREMYNEILRAVDSIRVPELDFFPEVKSYKGKCGDYERAIDSAIDHMNSFYSAFSEIVNYLKDNPEPVLIEDQDIPF